MRQLLALACLLMIQPIAARGAEVTFGSLLREMVDRDAPARLARPAFRLLQSSSHDPRKNDPGNAEGWHSNTDYGNFLHTEVSEGRREWVILEHEGPGAVVRFWTPLLADKDQQVIRFYFDHSTRPAITARFNDLLSGTGFVRPPFAYTAKSEHDLRDQLKPGYKAPRGVGGDLYLPIPFARACRITLDSVPFYYVINYRAYDPGTRVRSFSMAQFAGAGRAIAREGKLLLNPAAPRATSALLQRAVVAPRDEISLELPAGPAAVSELAVTVPGLEMARALRSVVVEAEFDGEPTVWCPLSEFFGAGVRPSALADWYRSVTPQGSLIARWTMAYAHGGRISLHNLGSEPVDLKLRAATRPWAWDSRSLHFHATWRSEHDMQTRPISDWNYLEMRGAGRYMGDTLTVYSPVSAWYGEGDERIYVDGATFPAHIGTGTEDYYGFAWGMAGYFSSPSMSMPLRDRMSQGDWQGYTTTSRVRLLDNIPTRTGIKHDMEIWNWADTRVDYSVGAFWYARPGATHNRPPQPAEASIAIHPLPEPYVIPNAIEFETLAVAASSPGLPIGTQEAGLTDGHWSHDSQLFVQSTAPGQFVEFDLPATGTSARRITLYGTRSHDYGIVRFTVNGRRAGPDRDLYAPNAVPTGPMELGAFAPVDGKLRLRVEVVGANPASKASRYFFGLDCALVHPTDR